MTEPAPEPFDPGLELGGADNVAAFPGAEEALEARNQAARAAQARRKAEFEYLRAGAEKRAARLPKALTGAFGHGVANLMLMKLLNGEVVPVTAKEAADVAKAAHDIGRSAQGRGPSDGPLTPEERAENMKQVSQLEQVLKDRAKKVGDEFLAGAPDTPDETLPDTPEADEWDFGDEVRDPEPG